MGKSGSNKAHPVLPDSAFRDNADLLLKASSALLSSIGGDQVLKKILDLAADFIRADGYAVWRQQDSGDWSMIASQGLSRDYLQYAEIHGGSTQVPAETLVIPDVVNPTMLNERQEAYRLEGIKSLLVVPLRVRDRNSGTLTYYFRAARDFLPGEIRSAEMIATLASAALGNSELYEEQLQLREQAEAQARRSSFLANASAIFGSSLEYLSTLRRVARLAVPGMADWCAVYVIEAGAMKRTAVAHSDPGKLKLADELYTRYPPRLEAGAGFYRCIHERTIEHVSCVTDQMLQAGAQDPYHLKLLRELSISSLLMLPMMTRDRVIGVLVFVMAESKRAFSTGDIEMARALAGRAASAIDNTLLYEAAQREILVRSRAETELRVSQERFRLVQRAARIGSWELDVESEAISGSPEFADILGHDATLGALTYSDLLSQMYFSGDRERATRALKKAMRAGQNKDYEVQFRIRHPVSGERLLASRGRVFYNDGKPLLIAVLVDITETLGNAELN